MLYHVLLMLYHELLQNHIHILWWVIFLKHLETWIMVGRVLWLSYCRSSFYRSWKIMAAKIWNTLVHGLCIGPVPQINFCCKVCWLLVVEIHFTKLFFFVTSTHNKKIGRCSYLLSNLMYFLQHHQTFTTSTNI